MIIENQEKIISKRFAWEKDEMIHEALKLAIQYKMLEDIYGKEEKKEYVKII